MRRPGAFRTAALVLACAVVLAAPAARADEPKPAASPAPADAAPAKPTPEGAATSPSAGGTGQDVDARPSHGVVGTIMGTILNMRRKPISGTMVQLSSRGDDSLLRVTGTNESGQYAFKDLPAGTYDIVVQSDTGAEKKERIEVRPPFRNIVDFQIGGELKATPGGRLLIPPKGGAAADAAPAPAKPVVVRGTFLDVEKRPVSEVSVIILPVDGTFAAVQAFSGDDGAFAVPDVPTGRYRVLIFSPGYVPIDLKAIDVPAAGLNLSLALVDYPLNMETKPDERLPREAPLPIPAPGTAAAAPSASPAPAATAPPS